MHSETVAGEKDRRTHPFNCTAASLTCIRSHPQGASAVPVHGMVAASLSFGDRIPMKLMIAPASNYATCRGARCAVLGSVLHPPIYLSMYLDSNRTSHQ